jgi:hypothetical protein
MFLSIEDVPDFRLDPPECRCARHPDECGCEHCHECRAHNPLEWNVEPECDFCLIELSQWIHENTDLPFCAYPEFCSYAPTCRPKGVSHDRKIA